MRRFSEVLKDAAHSFRIRVRCHNGARNFGRLKRRENLTLAVERNSGVASKGRCGTLMAKVGAPGSPDFLSWADIGTLSRQGCSERMRVEVW